MAEEYRIFISPAADRVFKKFHKRIQQEIRKELSPLTTNPFAGGRLSVPLNFLYSYHFTVFGKYFRAAYTFNPRQRKITLHYVGPRGGFYERLKRLFGQR